MIYSLQGRLACLERIESSYQLAIECADGVAFELKSTALTASQCPGIGENLKLYTHFVARENMVELFGFFDLQERKCFKMLISVSGVGPSFALSILSVMSPSQLSACIFAGDSKTLTKCKGVGAKTANRIILELKDKIGDMVEKDHHGAKNVLDGEILNNFDEAIGALVALGYSKNEASWAVGGLSGEMNSSQLIKEALKVLSTK